MIPVVSSASGRFCLAVALVACGASSAAAQRKKTTEFTRQVLLITNFRPGPGADNRLGRRAADAVRDRVAKLSNGREVYAVESGDLRAELERSSYAIDG